MRDTIQIFSGVALLALLLPFLLGAGDAASDQVYVQPDAKYKMITAKVASVGKTKLVVDRFNLESGATRQVTLIGDLGVPVTGQKKAWLELRKGDLASITYEIPTKRVIKIDVMKPTDHPAVAKTLGLQRTSKQGRVFTGWVKLKTDDTIVVRTPDEAPPSRRKGTRMRFERNDDTRVEKFRESWAEVRKGDRVTVYYGKGRPRPAKRVVVIHRGGERPLPAGLATRLFDPRFDQSVKDVDGIGEVEPGEEWRPEAAAPNAS